MVGRGAENNPGNYAGDLFGNELAQAQHPTRGRRERNGTIRINGVRYAQQRLFSGEDMRIPFPNTPLNKIPDRLGINSEPGTLFSRPDTLPQGTQSALFTTAADTVTTASPLPPAPTLPAVPISEGIEGKVVSPSPTVSLHERLVWYGASTLSNPELLTLALGSGRRGEDVTQRLSDLLESFHIPDLLNADFGELRHTYQLGEKRAAQLQAMLELARRLTLNTPERYTIGSPLDAARLLSPQMAYLDHEEMRVLVLDTKNAVLADKLLYQGTVNSSALRAGEIFRPAIARNAPGIIVAHNHPSGDPTPSPEDQAVTEQLIQAGKYLDVALVDHLIIGKNNHFTSLKERMRW